VCADVREVQESGKKFVGGVERHRNDAEGSSGLQEVYGEVFLACVEEPVAISQSHAQVFMHVGVSIWPARPMSMAFLPFANPITNGSQCSLNFCLSGCGATD
jgi:hypothetical protein